jgi:hypothetical protein
MKKVIIATLVLVLITRSGIAQDYNTYRSFDAAILRINGGMRSESRLEKAIIILANNSNQLNVRLTIPCHSVNYIPTDNIGLPSSGLAFNLKIDIRPWGIQRNLTSTKKYVTQGILTLNNISKPVKVEYIPWPSGPDQNGDFNLTMVIQFKARDFDLYEREKNSEFIIKISGARVNRV